MAATETKRNTLVETLNTHFAVFRDGLPLALGVHKAIKERMPDIDVAKLRLALRAHTSSFRYLKAVATGNQRFDLDGKPVGELTEEHRDVAAATLRERFRKAAERRMADEKAQKDARLEREAEEQRSAKLAQLAARFNSR